MVFSFLLSTYWRLGARMIHLVVIAGLFTRLEQLLIVDF